MELKFSKYQGTGNDFVIIDGIANPELNINELESQIAFLCDRRFGIGADGLIIIQDHEEFDFEMVYYNSDGNESSMCGNGGRCIVHFAYSKSYISEDCKFMAIDGLHLAKASTQDIALQMKEVNDVKITEAGFVLDTGSPHYVYLSEIPTDEEFIKTAKKIRFGQVFKEQGINVNCLEQKGGKEIAVLTYERGVEDITFSCGTGVVAAAIAQAISTEQAGNFSYKVSTKGGFLKVEGRRDEGRFKDLWLIGPAAHVYDGVVNLQNAHPDFPKLH